MGVNVRLLPRVGVRFRVPCGTGGESSLLVSGHHSIQGMRFRSYFECSVVLVAGASGLAARPPRTRSDELLAEGKSNHF